MAKVIIEVDVTEDDCKAATYALLGCCGGPAGDLNPEDVREYFLGNAVTAKLHEIRSRKKWDDLKLSEKLPKKKGRILTRVFDAEGKHHEVMLPGGPMQRPRVLSPREGHWPSTHADIDVGWYDNQPDPIWDFCLFCGNPDERK